MTNRRTLGFIVSLGREILCACVHHTVMRDCHREALSLCLLCRGPILEASMGLGTELEPSRNRVGIEYGIESSAAHETSILEDGIDFLLSV
jgi:hypothetical protein